MKRCTKCRRELSPENFARHKRSKDGLYPSCRECESETRKQYREANHATIRARAKDHYRRNADAIRAKTGAYYADNRDAVAVRQRERYTSDAAFRASAIERSMKRYAGSTDQMRAWARAHYAANREKKIKYQSEYERQRLANDPEYLQKRKEWRKAYRRQNLSRYAQHAMKRYAAKRNAVPKWADFAMIQAMYDYAAELTALTGIVHHVDHIVPLVSDIVCGLHCSQNMQILPAAENISKGNRRWPGMP